MSRIVLATHSPALASGYGRVARELARGLVEAGHEVTCLGMGHPPGVPTAAPFQIIPAPPMRAEDAIDEAIQSARPDVLLTVGDPWMFERVPQLATRSTVTWVAYFPVDGVPLPEAWRRWVQAVDVPVVFAKYTQDLVAAATGRVPTLIYHGVDLRTFAPGDKNEAKRRIDAPGRLVVGCVAANQQRKNLPALVRAFARFAKGKDDVMLYLHTPLQGCWDIPALIGQHGLDDKTRLTLGFDPAHGLDDATLVTLYNAFDVFALPTMAEGFGLPILESQACGVVALATDFSACSELLPDPFQRLRVLTTLVMTRNFEQAVVDEEDLARKLEVLYRDRARCEAMGRASRQFALAFDWSVIRRQFGELISGLKPR